VSTPSIISAIKKLKSLLTREEKLKWVWMMAFAFCTSLLEVMTATIIVIFAQVLNQPATGQKYLSKLGLGHALAPNRIVFYLALMVGIIYLIKNIVAAVEVFHQNLTIQKMNYRFKDKLLHRYAEADYGIYLTRNSSFGLQVISGDVEQMFSSGMIAIASILSESVIFVCLITMIIYMNPSIALTIFGSGAILGVGVVLVLPRFYRFGQRLQEAALYSGQHLLQFFHAFKEIILLGKRKNFIEAFRYHSQKKSHVQGIQTALNALPRMVIEVLFMGLFVTTVALLCLGHNTPMQMLGILGGYLYAGFRLMPGLNRIINQLNIFKSIIPCIERVHHEYTHIGKKENYLSIPELEFQNEISLNNIYFQYLNTKTDALSDISINIKKGECLGIAGETGSGKSTLVDIILGLLKPYQGTILLDGLYSVQAYQWHQKIGYVPQSIYLIDDTIEANIAFGEKEIDTEKLNAAIDGAQLRLFIHQLPMATKTIVGERGIRLSGGERQRIAIARALYRNPEVLIFDEATSALDTETEERLMETIHAVSHHRTVIMIAHRLTTLKNCHRIMIMEKGKIKEITQYQALIENKKRTASPSLTNSRNFIS